VIQNLLAAPDSRPVPLRHGYWIPGMEVLAGEYPGAREGRPENRKLEKLHVAGVTAFVDLTEPGELPSYSHRLTAIWGPDGVRHARFGIPDRRIPTDPAVMVAALDHLQDGLKAGHRMYLHCMGGVGRTGMTVACLLVRGGLAPDTALDVVAALFDRTPKRHRRAPETEIQREFVRGWPAMDPRLGGGLGREPGTEPAIRPASGPAIGPASGPTSATVRKIAS
jgi:protein-tyrosine phosphatase